MNSKQKSEPIYTAVKIFIAAIALVLIGHAIINYPDNYVFPKMHPGGPLNWIGFVILCICVVAPSGILWAWLPEEKQPNAGFGLGMAFVLLTAIGAALMFS